MQVGYQGGLTATGGISQVAAYYSDCSKIEGQQLWGALDGTAREADEVLASVGKAVVR